MVDRRRCSVAGGAGFSLLLVTWDTALIREIPPAALSRVSSYDWMGSLGLFPFGFLLAGPISESIGVQETLFGGAAIALVLGLLVAFAPPIRHLSVEHGHAGLGRRGLGVEAARDAPGVPREVPGLDGERGSRAPSPTGSSARQMAVAHSTASQPISSASGGVGRRADARVEDHRNAAPARRSGAGCTG